MPEREDVETRELSCELTEAELLTRGDAMADCELKIEQLKLKRSVIADQIKAQRAERRKLAGVIDAGKEQRDVRCVWIEKFEQNCFELVRQDTGAVVDTRAMTAADRQGSMGFDDDAEGPIGEDDELPEGDPPARRNVDPDPDDERPAARGGRFNA